MKNKTTFVFVILLVIAAFLVGIIWIKLKDLEQTKSTSGSKPEVNSLAMESLKQDGVELGLNSDIFNQCLDSGQHKSKVEEDVAYGTQIGVSGTPAFFINGRFLGGAFPIAAFKEIIDKEIAGKGSDNAADYSDYLQQAAKPGPNNQPAAFIAKARKLEIDESAKVTLMEFADFQCPYCVQIYPTVKHLMSDYPDDLRIIFKQFPLPGHQFAQKAAEATLCAKDQGKFWEYHDKLFEKQLEQ